MTTKSTSYRRALSNDMFDLLEIFRKHSVEYLIVGAHAVNAYTEARMTKDLDIWVNPSQKNAQKTFEALKEFGAPLASVSEVDFSDEESFFIIGIKPNRIDILKKIPGVIFEEAWKQKHTVTIDSLDIFILSYEDIVKAKIASGRPQDLLDVEKLKKARPR